METTMTLTDTEETICTPTAEDDKKYKAFGEDLQSDALALLATVRHLMTGHEIDVCEAAADIENSEGVPVYVIESLRNQFYAQICNHKDKP
jgi:hypothetical protein